MTRVMLVLGWVLAIVAAGIAGGASYIAVEKSRALTALQAKFDSLTTEKTATETRLNEKISTLEKTQETLKTASATDTNKDLMSAANAWKNALTAGKTDGNDPQKTDMPFAGMFKGEKGKEMAKMGASMAVNMQYGDLFNQLQLSPETEQRVKDLITSNMSDQISKSMDAMGNKSSLQDMHKSAKESEAQLRAELSKLLTPEQLALYDQYQQEMPERMLGQSVDMQLSMFASGLSAEDRTQARQVIVEEMINAGGATDSTGIPANGNMQDHLQKQQAALQRARDRLAETMDADKVAQVDRFVNQLNQIMNMSASMFTNNQSQGNTTNKTP